MSYVATIKALYEAFARGDVPNVLGAMDPEIRWHEAEGNPYAPDGKPFVGPEGVFNGLFVKQATEWDGFAVHPVTFHDAGDVVVVEVRYGGTYKETGKAIDCQGCHVWDLAGGKITKFRQYMDTAQIQDVMGVRAGA